MEVRDAFMSEGGQVYQYIPALNDRPQWINGLKDIIDNELKGWRASHWSSERALEERRIEENEARARGGVCVTTLRT
jgi:ferrochelatase